ncbi:MAG: (d)CMP kinase [Clostridia bacterium]|nr:(d)CMP kinase [Clostridia bacterium]
MIKIAIDGFTGSGKGTLAAGIAKIFGLKHLDTGAIFRGIGCGFIDMGFTDLSNEIVNENINKISIAVEFDGDKQKIILNGNDITHLLRTEQSSQMASKVSVYAPIREKYLEIVREFANNYDCIIDGRDITSVVLPNADVKIFLDADEKIRAQRRYQENVEKNIPCTYEEVLKNLQERDYRDSHRDIAPLKKVDDAILLDNSNLNQDETIALCEKIIRENLAKKGKI